ncbi:MAG TPA: hypothetical protein VEF76_01635, partial [Patescibacteria group bacterium]|nr:hypothetical protein [Patescibacteria group bacterium]
MKRFLPAICALLLLAGCGMSDRISQSVFGDKPALPDCPETGMLPDSGVFPVFKGDGDEVSATGRVLGVSGTCSAEHPGVIDMEIKIGFGVAKNDAGFAPKKMALPYFIAILSPDEQVLQRQSFSTKVDFDNADSAASAEEH